MSRDASPAAGAGDPVRVLNGSAVVGIQMYHRTNPECWIECREPVEAKR